MSKAKYRVSPEVAFVNGGKVPPARIVELTIAEAAFDLAHGRIAPVKRPRKSRKAKSGELPNGGN